MEKESSIDEFYYLSGDEKSEVGNCSPVDKSIRFDFFYNKNDSFELKEPLVFKIDEGKSSGKVGDYQFNSCGFLLFSEKLRQVIEKYLPIEDKPTWFPAKVIDLNNQEFNFYILYFFAQKDFLDHINSTFVTGTDHPIKKRYDLLKIGERQVFKNAYSINLCVHNEVRKEIKKANCSGVYFYKVHTAGRLS